MDTDPPPHLLKKKKKEKKKRKRKRNKEKESLILAHFASQIVYMTYRVMRQTSLAYLDELCTFILLTSCSLLPELRSWTAPGQDIAMVMGFIKADLYRVKGLMHDVLYSFIPLFPNTWLPDLPDQTTHGHHLIRMKGLNRQTLPGWRGWTRQTLSEWRGKTRQTLLGWGD